MRTPTETELAWLAGFFDGEGCVSIFKIPRLEGKYIEYKMTVSISQKDKRPLEAIRGWFGGNVTLNQSSGVWKWTRSAQQARIFLEAVRPYLKLKHEQVDVALAFQERKKESKKLRSASFVLEREAFRELNEADRILIKDLKVVGV